MRNIVDGTTWKDHLAGAMRAFRLSDLDLAEQRLDKAFASVENAQPVLHLLAGHIAVARGSVAEAEKSWRRVLEVDPDHAEAWNNLGVLYRRRGDDEKALDAFLEAQERSPDRPDIPYNIGNLHKGAGRHDEAVAAYNRAIEIDPNYAPAYNNLGTLYESRKERDKAMEVFRRGLSADGRDAALRFNMGLVYQEQSRWDDARDAFETALKSRPGWVPGLNNLGIVLQEMGREDEAARTFRTLLDIEPDNVSALNNLGVAYDRLGRTADARKCYKKALANEPAYSKAALNLHDSYRETKELSEALEEINKQITHHPTDPEIRVRMARTLIGLARWTEAEQSLDHVLERDSGHSGALRAKADLLLATSRPDEAEALLRRLPHDPDSVRDLARLNLSTDRSEAAERLLSELITVDPDDAESRRLLSDLVAEADPERALALREEAAFSDRGQTEDLLAMARLNGRLGRKDEALGKLDEAVSLLGSRGEAEDLDSMHAVLGLYENASAALEEEKRDLFTERTMQLGRKLLSALGRPGDRGGRRKRFITEEIPLEEEDALSLLDINSMEPVIRINEEEETVYLDESAEDLEDAYTELYRPEHDEPPYPGGGGRGPMSPRGDGQPSAQAFGPSPRDSQGPPIHIHLSPQTAVPSPQVIYQDVRPVTVREAFPVSGAEPGISVTEMPEGDLPEFPESPKESVVEEIEEEFGASEEAVPEELVLEEEDLLEDAESDVAAPPHEGGEVTLEITESEEPQDDGGFLVPDSDALSEDLPEDAVYPESEAEPDLLFDIGAVEEEDALIEEYEPEAMLVEALDEEDEEIEPDATAAFEPVEPEEAAEAPEVPVGDFDAGRMAKMFKYLTELTDQTSGEGRDLLIREGVPLKLAGLSARLSGERNFRAAAQKFDRRRRERHNIELDEDKIKDSLGVFKKLAEAYPGGAIRESLSQKLGSIMTFVGKKDEKTEEDGTGDGDPQPN